MPITHPQKIAHVVTAAPPAAASLSNQYYLAWTNQDATISWALISVNSAGSGYDVGTVHKSNNPSALMTAPGFGPALTTFNGQIWMAFLQNAAQAPPIPGAGQNQPPVIMVTSLSGTTWSTPQPLWSPADTANLVFIGPAAISAPAIASTAPFENGTAADLLIVWVEHTANGSDAPIAKSASVPNTPPLQSQVFFTTPQTSTVSTWNQRQPVKSALTNSAPALVGGNGIFYLAWQGLDDTIWFATYTAGIGWSDAAKLPNFKTSAGPALAFDGSSNVQLVWKGKSDNYIYMATLSNPSAWLPGRPGHSWSTQFRMPGIATTFQPALASQLATQDTLLAFSGETSFDVWMVTWNAVSPVLPGPSSARINYLITNYDINQPLENMIVTVVAKQDLLNTSDSAADGNTLGFSFQLNCQPPGTIEGGTAPPVPPENTTQPVWLQFGIRIDGRAVSSWYDNSTNAGIAPEVVSLPLFTLPSPNTIPRGYKIQMKLVTDPSTKIVTELSVNAWDSDGFPIYGFWETPGLKVDNGEGPWLMPISVNDAPILNLEVNIGGKNNGEHAFLFQDDPHSQGATVSYESDHPLMVTATRLETAESSNIKFGLLAAYPPNPIVQSFSGS